MKWENELFLLDKNFEKHFVVIGKMRITRVVFTFLNIFDTHLDASMSWFLSQVVYSQNKDTV